MSKKYNIYNKKILKNHTNSIECALHGYISQTRLARRAQEESGNMERRDPGVIV